jgi:hypothetical protein
MTDLKFQIGDKVKRINGQNTGEGVEAIGMIGEIKHIVPACEWPPNSGRFLPMMYSIHFPKLYEGTRYDGILLNVIEGDLELWLSEQKEP